MPRTGSTGSTFGEALKRAREAKGWSQSELARRLSSKLGERVTPGTVNRWEKPGNFGPPRYRVDALAELLGIGVEILLVESPKDRTPSVPTVDKTARPIPLVGAAAAGEAMAKIYESHDLQVFHFPPGFLREMYRAAPDLERAILMKVEGDSMGDELPNGAYVFVDRGPGGEGWSAEQVGRHNDNDVYMVRPPDEDGVTLKRISIQAGWLHLYPAAGARGYKARSFQIPKGTKIQSIVRGRVVGHIERH